MGQINMIKSKCHASQGHLWMEFVMSSKMGCLLTTKLFVLDLWLLLHRETVPLSSTTPSQHP